MKSIVLFCLLFPLSMMVSAQCPPDPDPGTAYGSNNVWIGYVYNNVDFTDYAGIVHEGNASSPDFFQDFGGGYVNYPTSGCDVYTETFSVRYRLRKNFSAGIYEFTVGGNDGVRLSLDGGNTWVIDEWRDQSYTQFRYTTELSAGDHDLVLEFYESSYTNEVSFSVTTGCLGAGTDSDYGQDDNWYGYIYEGIDFQSYKGRRDPGNFNFADDFGNGATFNTNSCAVVADYFSARYKLNRTFAPGTYTFVVGGDDGYRFSLDGGATWVIDNWGFHGYEERTYTTTLSGTRNMVLEYFDGGAGNVITFNMLSVLPIKLVSFDGRLTAGKATLQWVTSATSTPDEFIIEKSNDGRHFNPISVVKATANTLQYHFTDPVLIQAPVFYRLKMTDLEGIVTYSKIVTVNANIRAGVKIYPTLLEQQRTLFVHVNQQLPQLTLRLFNISGQMVLQQHYGQLASGQVASFALDGAKIGNGIYMAEVSSNNGVILRQKIVVK